MTLHQKITAAVAACLLCAPGTGSAKDKDKHDDDNTAERVEIKYLVPEKDIVAVSKRFNLDMDHPTEMRVVCFYDTKSQELFQRSPRVILRSRCATGVEKPETDTTVKIRGKRVEREKVECESDLVIGKPKPVPSCSLTDKTQGEGEIKRANEGKDVKKIFDHAQEKFVEEGGVNDLDWDKLVPFGPVNDVKVWKHLPAEGFERNYGGAMGVAENRQQTATRAL